MLEKLRLMTLVQQGERPQREMMSGNSYIRAWIWQLIIHDRRARKSYLPERCVSLLEYSYFSTPEQRTEYLLVELVARNTSITGTFPLPAKKIQVYQRRTINVLAQNKHIRGGATCTSHSPRKKHARNSCFSARKCMDPMIPCGIIVRKHQYCS